ncbi:TauD/TfdA dioxygenase family protein [Enterovirga aerilata]|uniref:TauD/TfdA family dioxygenase n=1 Tax=Enterovirga aerilata TaxID=2730920 RepID=A0A849HWW7_9HYPH|nr:TauD/TfdA family dioxygenase [Enterovirga sp. DB1703]NNM71602.1 TauD/TfdA family dioxygenase [Enterovirga sp. DB1703]
MAIQVTKLSAGIGAEIGGVDLTKPISDADFAAIEKAWQDHVILLFRGQKLTHEQHVAFSRRFGELDDHRTIPKFRDPDFHEILPVVNAVIDGRKQPVGRQWHSDLSTTLRPARGSLLRCEVIPPVGGDTMFANMYLAYETLSDKMKELLDGLWGIQDMTVARHSRGRDLSDVRKRNPPVAQPVVRVHPETGRKALFVAEMTTTGIVGMKDEEAQPILEYLFRHSVQPEFTYRHRWQPDDMIAWDNRCAMHLALDDYDINIPRRLYRTTLLGEPLGYIVADEEMAQAA